MMCGLKGSRRDDDAEFVVKDDVAVGAGKWCKGCRYRFGDFVVSDREHGAVGGTGREEAAEGGGGVGVVPDGFDVV